jgi:hypothetical protein
VKGNEEFEEGSMVTLEVDLDASPRTLRFFVDDKEQPVFVSGIPQSINFAVCSSCPPVLHFAAGHIVQQRHQLHTLPPRGRRVRWPRAAELDGTPVGHRLVISRSFFISLCTFIDGGGVADALFFISFTFCLFNKIVRIFLQKRNLLVKRKWN